MSAIITGSMTRSLVSGSPGPLAIGQGNGLSFLVGGLKMGRRSWRRTVVSSPVVPGEYETAAVLDQIRDPEFRFRARAATQAALLTLVTSLVTAVEQATWDLTVTVAGQAWPTVTCTRADSEVIFDMPLARSVTATILVYTTRSPSTSGPI